MAKRFFQNWSANKKSNEMILSIKNTFVDQNKKLCIEMDSIVKCLRIADRFVCIDFFWKKKFNLNLILSNFWPANSCSWTPNNTISNGKCLLKVELKHSSSLFSLFRRFNFIHNLLFSTLKTFDKPKRNANTALSSKQPVKNRSTKSERSV